MNNYKYKFFLVLFFISIISMSQYETQEYKLISNTGPRHKPIFKVGVKLPNTKYFIATGKSKKEAEQNAAIECLKNTNKK